MTAVDQMLSRPANGAPPNTDRALECRLLGAILTNPGLLDHLEVDIDMMTSTQTRRAFAALRAIHARGEDCNTTALQCELSRTDDLNRVGGHEFTLGLTESIEVNPEPIAVRLRELADARHLDDCARRASACAREGDIEEARRWIDAACSKPTRPSRVVARIRSPLDWSTTDPLGEPPPPRRWLLRRRVEDGCEGFLPAGKVGVLAGEGGSGKTQALVQLSLAVALGRTWLGPLRCTEGGPCLLVLGEEDEAEVHRRLYHATRVAELDARQRGEAAANIDFLALAGEHARILERDACGNLTSTAFATDLAARLPRRRPTWSAILVDPLSRFGPVDVETDNATATATIAALEALCKLPGSPTVVIAHHVRKGKGDTVQAGDVRGASGIVDAARFVATLGDLRSENGASVGAVLATVKSNYAARGAPVYLARDEGGALREMTPDELSTLRPFKGAA